MAEADIFSLSTTSIFTSIGLVGNSIVLYILTRKQFRSIAMFRYYIALTIAETIALLSAWPFVLPKVFIVDALMCKLATYFLNAFSQLMPWINVITLIDRFINIKYPKRFLFRNDFKFQLATLTITLGLIMILDTAYYIYTDLYTYFNSTHCAITDGNIALIVDSSNFSLFTILPFTLMIAFTSLIGWQLIKNKMKLQKTTFKKEIQLIKIMFAISALFLFTYLPILCTIIAYDLLLLSNSVPDYMSLIFTVNTFCFYLYCASNFFLYLFFNKLFRTYFFSMLSCRRKRANTTILSNAISKTKA